MIEMKDEYKYVGDRGMYLNIARDVMIDNPTFRSILKTDCHNEAHNRPIGGILTNILKEFADQKLVYKTFDCDEDRLWRARVNFPGLVIDEFDMRLTDLPYKDGQFDVIFDFSTIDHIDIDRAFWIIGEYNRLLTTHGGKLVVVVWLTHDNNSTSHYSNVADWSPDTQYFFDKTIFIKTLKEYFKVNEIGTVLERSEWEGFEGQDLPRELTYLLCEKIT